MRTPVSGADFDDPTDLQVKTDNGGAATPAGMMDWERAIAKGAGTFDNSVGKILDIRKNLLVTAIDLTQIEMPDPVADLDQKVNGIQLIDFRFGCHQGLAAMRALDMNVEPMSHCCSPLS
jgi:hypothetical protein